MNNVIGKAKGGGIDISRLNNFRQIYDGKVSGWIGNPIDAGRNRLAGNALRNSIQSIVDKLGIKTTTGLSLKEAGLELSKLYGVHDLAALQNNLSRGNLPFGLMQALGFIGGGAIGNFPGAVGGAMITQLANTPRVISGVSKATTGIGQQLQNIRGGDLIKRLATATMTSPGSVSEQTDYKPQ